MPKTNLNTIWADLIVEECARNGVSQFFLSPGSRSTPLTTAVARNSKVRSFMHFDERGAAFAALGYARATGRPAALVCTSGTAAANYLPAIVEASQDCIPLVLLTSDRPAELLDCGANQAIDQNRIYQTCVRYEVQLPTPSDEIPAQYVLSTVDQAIYRARSGPRGPVHLNCAYRKPLDPREYSDEDKRYLSSIAEWQKDERPFTTYIRPERGLSSEALSAVERVLGKARRGVVLLGRLESEEAVAAAEKLAESWSWPIFADVSSGARLASSSSSLISYADLLLGQEKLSDLFDVDVVLHIGGQLVFPRMQQFFKSAGIARIQLVDHPLRKDPDHCASLRLEAEIATACCQLMQLDSVIDMAWVQELRELNRQIDRNLEEGSQSFSEPSVVRALSRLLPEGHCLFCSNSLPVRHLENFAVCRPDGPRSVGMNRGASGIDGIIASSIGYAMGKQQPLTLLIGDLAFMHDMNSLALIRQCPVPITIVVLNNSGGGIFSFLPIHQHESVFSLFETPHTCRFKAAAELFGLDYVRVEAQEIFCENYLSFVTKNRGGIIEVTCSADSVVSDVSDLKECAARNIQEVMA